MNRNLGPGLLVAALGAPLALSGRARAEPPLTPSQSELEEVVPPRVLAMPLDGTQVPPAPLDVTLELVVLADGSVAEAIVVAGLEPYASQVAHAARTFTFQPATRGGAALAARVRFLVRLGPPPAEAEAPAARGARVRPVPAPPRPPPRPLEVRVFGARPAQVVTIITRAESRELPGTFGDPLRAIEASPGVSPIFSGVPFFFVRGAPPGNVGFFLDGIRVPMLYHALLGPSVLHPALIDHVDFHPGVAPARYAGFAGATVAAVTREPAGRTAVDANARLFDAGALAETPVLGGRGSILAGGRYAYGSLVASKLLDASFAYWDYQGRATLDVGSRARVGVLAFGAYDRFDGAELAAHGGGTEFHRVDVRYDTQTSHGRFRAAVTLGQDASGAASGTLSSRSVSGRTLWVERLTGSLALELGAETTLARHRLALAPGSEHALALGELFPSRSDFTTGAHAELAWSPSPWLTVAPGARVDFYQIGGAGAAAVDPRVAAAFQPAAGLRLTQTLGLEHQPANFVPQVPAAEVGRLDGGLETAWLASSGLELELPGDLGFSATYFRSDFANLLDPIGADRDFRLDRTELTRRVRGSSVGLELGLRRALTRSIGGFLFYTLSRTTRSTETSQSLAAFDRPHVLQGALVADLGARFRAGARALVYSGIPGLFLARDAKDDAFLERLRAPPYFRLDLRLEKRFPWFDRGYWAIVLELLNATLSREVTARVCSSTRCLDTRSGPLTIPSLGLEGHY